MGYAKNILTWNFTNLAREGRDAEHTHPWMSYKNNAYSFPVSFGVSLSFGKCLFWPLSCHGARHREPALSEQPQSLSSRRLYSFSGGGVATQWSSYQKPVGGPNSSL